jgi:hypothetical protein
MSLIRLKFYYSSVYQTKSKFSRTLFVLRIVLLYTDVIYLVFSFMLMIVLKDKKNLQE